MHKLLAAMTTTIIIIAVIWQPLHFEVNAQFSDNIISMVGQTLSENLQGQQAHYLSLCISLVS